MKKVIGIVALAAVAGVISFLSVTALGGGAKQKPTAKPVAAPKHLDGPQAARIFLVYLNDNTAGISSPAARCVNIAADRSGPAPAATTDEFACTAPLRRGTQEVCGGFLFHLVPKGLPTNVSGGGLPADKCSGAGAA